MTLYKSEYPEAGVCSECNKPCSGEMDNTQDDHGRDIYFFVSMCCAAEIHDDNGNPVPEPLPEEAPFDDEDEDDLLRGFNDDHNWR